MNLSTNFEGTDYIFLNIKRDNLKLEEISCDLCGKEHLSVYWKFGMTSVTKRANHLCDDCHTVVDG